MSINTPPNFTYISPGLLGNMRREVRRFLQHTYTRTSRLPVTNASSAPVLDAWGQQTYQFIVTQGPGLEVDAQQETGIPCFYTLQEVAFPTPDGLTTLNRPILTLGFDDPTQVGDHVSNIQTSDGAILVVGPVVVESLQLRDPNVGGPVLIEAHLRDVQFVPTS